MTGKTVNINPNYLGIDDWRNNIQIIEYRLNNRLNITNQEILTGDSRLINTVSLVICLLNPENASRDYLTLRGIFS